MYRFIEYGFYGVGYRFHVVRGVSPERVATAVRKANAERRATLASRNLAVPAPLGY